MEHFTISGLLVSGGVKSIRVILNSPPEKAKEDCWKVYSMLADEYTPSHERLRDWLRSPENR